MKSQLGPINRFLSWVLCHFFFHIDIPKTEDGVVRLYLRRWFIELGPDLKSHWYNRLLCWIILSAMERTPYLHLILMSDNDRDPHDHPWSWRTRVLWNGYDDWGYLRPVFGMRIGPQVDRLRFMSSRRRSAGHLHFVKLRNNRPCWTLVVREKYEEDRDWGFVDERGAWIRWDVYLKVPVKDRLDRLRFDVEGHRKS